MWIFGYGSLLWKVDFPYESRVIGFIKGYVRRFWQASEDHRGRPGRPGRVVTIVPSTDPEAQVWGVAYEVSRRDEEFVINHLDMRERMGYERVTVTFYPSDPDAAENTPKNPFDLAIYVGNEGNEWFAGSADIESIAQQIVTSVGQSGTNTEYLYKLASAMRQVAPGISDEHLFRLESTVRRLERCKSADRRLECRKSADRRLECRKSQCTKEEKPGNVPQTSNSPQQPTSGTSKS